LSHPPVTPSLEDARARRADVDLPVWLAQCPRAAPRLRGGL